MQHKLLGLVVAGAVASAGLTGATLAAAPDHAAALTTTQATDAYDAFVDTYWDPDAKYFFTYSDHQVHSEHAVGPQGGLYTDYWWEAQNWEAVMDRYQRSHDSASRQMIDDVFDGWVAAYPDFRTNDWNDDMGWWARGSIRAYELTGEQRFLTEAEDIFGYIAQYEDTTYGGGIWWKNVDVGNGSANEKNVATNGTAVWTALRLYAATGDTTYRDTAERIFSWLHTNFTNGGHIRDHVSGTGQFTDYDWTYNQGQYAGAALQMYLATHDAQYLTQATTATDWAVANLTTAGTFLDEGTNDTEGFKAILTRDIRALIDDAGQTQYEQVLTANASQAANHVSAEGIGGPDWNAPTPSIASTPQQSLGAAATVAITQQGTPDGSTAVVQGDGVYQAENVDHPNIGTEASNAGYTGRGYLAGWNTDGTAATFHANVATTGTHAVTFRYAAAAGTAVRAVSVNGSAPVNVTFPGTSSWSTWGTVTVDLPFGAGSDALVVADTASSGSTNYLNLDAATVGL
jgi:predicted alpha-1,6-mannanase (GH76 family)